MGIMVLHAAAEVDAAVTSEVPFQQTTLALLELPFTGTAGLLLFAFRVTRTHL